MVRYTKIISRHNRVLQNLPAFVEIVRPGIGQCLEQSQRHDELANTAGVLPVITTMLTVNRMCRIADIKHSNTVVGSTATKHSHQLLAKGRIRRRQIHVRVVKQTKIHFIGREQGTSRLFAPGDDPFIGKPGTFHPSDTGLFIAVQRIGTRQCWQQHCRQENKRKSLHFGTSCILTFLSMFPCRDWSILFR